MNPRLFPSLAALVVAASLCRDGHAAAPPPEVTVGSSRVHVGDVVPGTSGDLADVDLGAAPSVGGSRLVSRADVVGALAAKNLQVPPKVPALVRVVRKIKRLTPTELEALVRQTAEGQSVGRGVQLVGIHPQHSLDVPEGWSRLNVEIPHAPKKAGGFSTSATLSFLGPDDEVLVRAMVPVDLVVSDAGATYDAPRGATVTLVVRQNLVEIRASGVTEGDADVGDPVAVQLGMSGRVVHARLLSRDEALAVETRP